MAALQGCFLLQLCAPQLSVGHGGTGQGVPAGSLSLLCVLVKGLHLQVTLKGGVARAPEAFGLVFCSCKDSVGSEIQ